MKMRVKKSEYQRAYAEPNQTFFETVYKEQLSYRKERRERENGHMIFCWESESSDSVSDNASNEEVTQQNQENVDEENSVEDRLKSKEDFDEKNESPVSQDQALKRDNCTQTPTMGRKSRPRSKQSQTSSRDASAGKPPFVSYGWADNQKETGRKKTHNVQAPKQSVHKAALQRQNYIQSERKKQKQKGITRAQSLLSRALFQKKQVDNAVWQSEYQRCYSQQSTRPDTASSTVKPKTGKGKRQSKRKC